MNLCSWLSRQDVLELHEELLLLLNERLLLLYFFSLCYESPLQGLDLQDTFKVILIGCL